MIFSQWMQNMTAPRHWQQLGFKKRAGVLAPLFSIYSKESAGVGEIPDLELLAEWCSKTGISIIQILPLNDIGWDFRPYDSQSAFAIDPMYLRIRSLRSIAFKPFESKILELEKEYSVPRKFVDYSIKARKLELFWNIFQHPKTDKKRPEFLNFLEREKNWLDAYASFKICKELNQNKAWWEWPDSIRRYDARTVEKELAPYAQSVLFHKWLQWQAMEQLQQTALRVRARHIVIMADMPFLVSRDSADVWMNPRFFKLDREAGAPPDLYVPDGQRWGMPPYRWEEIEADGFRYLKDRIKYLSRYAHMYRLDHFVGLCRLWTIDSSEPYETQGKHGAFDPPDEKLWHAQGEKIVKAMLSAADMLPCAEDLGSIPACSYDILSEYQIPGSDVQRWMRHWEGDGEFSDPQEYRQFSISSLSTHDMPSFPLWWVSEATPEEKKKMLVWAELTAADAEKPFSYLAERILKRVLETRSIFSVHALQDWLSLTEHAEFFKPDHQINKPGKILPENWSIRMPFSLEQMLALPINATIRRMVENSSRKV